MAKFVALCVSFALFAVAIGSPFHSKLGRNVPFRGHDVGYHVSIQVNDWWNDIPKHSCSGTLIADRWVLTTAKCIHQSFDNLGLYSEVTIQGGDPNLQGYYTSRPWDYHLHDNADIGLINIQQPMRESYCCSFAKLPTTPLETGDIVKGVLTGQSSNNEWKLELVEEAQFEAVDDTTCGDLLNVAPHSLCSVVQSATTSAPQPTPTSEAPVEPSSSAAPVDPSTSDAPVDPSTSDAPVDPSTSDAPVDPSTGAPVDPSTSEAPVDPSTSDSPVDPSTGAPVSPSTSDSLVDPSTGAPVNPSTEAPVNPSTSDSLVDPSTEAPVSPSTSDSLVDPSTRAPVNPSTSDSLVDPSTEAPVDPSTSDSLVDPSTGAPVDPSTSDSLVDPSTGAPVNPSTSDSLVDPSTEAPVQALRAKYTAAPTCLADIGGPLVQDSVVVGLVSRGGCVNGQTATVLTDVSAFTGWIKSVVGEDDYFD